jgi:hypothetical protein
MPIPMMNYSFSGGCASLISFSISSFMYGLMMSAREFSLDDLEEDMVALDFEVDIRQKQIETKKRRENNIPTLGPRDYIGESLTTKGRHRMKPGQKQTLRRPHHQVVRPAGGPTPWGSVVPPGTISYPFSSRKFSYLIKTTKV